MAKLLIVDDEADIREFAKSYFSKRDIDVMTAEGGEAALEIIEQEKPNLVLLDITMEDISGIDVLRKLRENGNQVSVVMVTGIEDQETINEANQLGIKGYIHKPLVLDELESIVLKELKA